MAGIQVRKTCFHSILILPLNFTPQACIAYSKKKKDRKLLILVGLFQKCF